MLHMLEFMVGALPTATLVSNPGVPQCGLTYCHMSRPHLAWSSVVGMEAKASTNHEMQHHSCGALNEVVEWMQADAKFQLEQVAPLDAWKRSLGVL
eukprot:1138728-Pelagomonas_calceolata.AAC.4